MFTWLKVRRLSKQLSAGDVQARENATSALGELGDACAVEPLIVAMLDQDREVREAAAQALAKLGECAVEPLINAMLESKNNRAREAAAEAPRKLDDPRTAEILTERVTCGLLMDRIHVVVALGQLGGPRAFDSLIKILGRRDCSDVTAWAVRDAAARAAAADDP
jgi:HEAT repeat protein